MEPGWSNLAPTGSALPGEHRHPQRQAELYVDTDGLLRRRDYVVDVAAGSPAAHYMDDHREFDGIPLPVRRVVYARNEIGHPVRDMVLVTIDIDDIAVS